MNSKEKRSAKKWAQMKVGKGNVQEWTQMKARKGSTEEWAQMKARKGSWTIEKNKSRSGVEKNKEKRNVEYLAISCKVTTAFIIFGMCRREDI